MKIKTFIFVNEVDDKRIVTERKVNEFLATVEGPISISSASCETKCVMLFIAYSKEKDTAG